VRVCMRVWLIWYVMMRMLTVSVCDKLMCVSECNLRKRACVSVIVRTRSTNSIGESEKARARKRESEKVRNEKARK
jgi:hypothetical protein